MLLASLLEALPSELQLNGWESRAAIRELEIRGISYDSRRVEAGDLFFALRGAASDGHDFLAAAFERGAAAAIVETAPADLDAADRPIVAVRDSRRALAPISAQFFGHPASELTLIGITGTNGKTSTTYLVESILERSGHASGVIGTLDIRYAGAKQPAVNTTPESYEIQRSLRAMRDCGVTYAVMEVSSHGLALERVWGCQFSIAALTNISQDHLDFHESMDAYRDAKLRLFDTYLRAGGSAVVNIDDANADAFMRAAGQSGAKLVRVSRKCTSESAADVRLERAQVALNGTDARIALPSGALDLKIPIVGDFNLENALVACGIAVALEIEPEIIAQGIENCPQVPGRVERVQTTREAEPVVIVDYAHTPDAVEKLLATLRPLAKERLVAVFGCGGDRDRGKRPRMAEAVARWSDRVVATSDNPRSEDPLQILEDVEPGLAALQRVEADALDATDASYAMISDRRQAIQTAIGIARPGDMVVIAGKGHEDYQIVGPDRLHFDDREEARDALLARSSR
ncbi:MAG: UDP-N-acetylmuramoyl-L-alanyl-D-glutamate--2,6-diaminopimelate ligase [Deltaproteobacteria bacterium]|jgi:UDP-N-acetylmuramoyl-L-alanyl-D-glutamate--2,6-diaminopimelate ligase|nr:UDP-N-acetylmuramoyl-L-alanyl-D-glutamate--2,6-diaminopimelate ligase [Deltaproteobacteria bacterium]